MRLIILPAMIVIALLCTASALAQTGQPHVTETVTGPVSIAPGGQATFDVAIDVAGAEADIYITWQMADSGSFCCDLVSSEVISGQAIGEPVASPFSQRWTVFGPHAEIRLIVKLHDDVTTDAIIVGGYLPGTDVAQYLTGTSTKTIVSTTPLPQTGGPPASDESTFGPEAVAGGAAMLLLSGVCFAAAIRRRLT